MSGNFAFGIFQSKDVLALVHFVPRTFRPGTLRSLAVSVSEMILNEMYSGQNTIAQHRNNTERNDNVPQSGQNVPALKLSGTEIPRPK